MNGDDNIWTDEQLAALFARAAGDATPPDEEFLLRLRDASAEAFAASNINPSQINPPRRRSKMAIYTLRLAAAAAAAIVAAATWFFASGPVGDGATLAQALDKLAAAKTLHFEVKVDDKATEAWSRQPGQLRWNLADGQYQIAQGDRLWLVDEKANRAASKPADCFRGEQKAVDLLSFLVAANLVGTIDNKARETLLAAKPARRETRGDAEFDLYEVRLPSSAGDLLVEAAVDCRTGLPRSLDVRQGRDGKFVSLAAIDVLAVDGPVPEELFVVGDALTEDGRIGKVIDAQGLCGVKPVMAERWTPLGEGLLLMPGDWLRTDLRGANAVAARLVRDVQLVIGPGALVELVGPKQIRINSGDVKVVASEKTPLEVSHGKQTVLVKGTQLFHVDHDKLARLDKDPLWLKGFEGRVVGESIGSLVANIDGRNTPLTVGYHKVTVDIRDQIARTVVEESFVNHTNARTEGVFYFPLPADASISGFGMWIGSELVEADVVEKQRAREIYETILRERRDPGLLEWSGGNIFKARVFPIEAHSEKRIKITYTQVLPLHGNSFRYSYALQSEMLKQHPLRELSIDVKLNSVVPLKSVASPTHPVRTQQTAHSAHVEFAAQEYTPTRDFEVVVETDGKQSELVLIPHRRGDDGYFMALLTPPALENASPRDLLPEGGPLDLLVLADTSASLDRGARTVQAEFLAALLGTLTPKDKLNVAGCDVECDWVFEQSMPADEKNIEAAREFLAKRVSLGWTDLDKAFASAFTKAGSKTRVIYVGDGIVTTGDADAVAFGKRLRRLYDQSTHHAPRDAGALRDDDAPRGTVASGLPHAEREEYVTCYAVSVGSSYEAAALQAIASCGGGSVRQISGECGPTAAARDLLGEIARPALRDLKIEFRGLRTARVYPQELPNLSLGAQQIILGRYLPSVSPLSSGEGQGVRAMVQDCEVIVTGTLDGRPIRYASRVSLADAEQGNSFIPRLWARMHLDQLLQQGSSQAIQDEIIALSEEYNIMTPYTSLLVLESDADRERFKVKRRFAMRDGEKFFAEGRDNVNYELTQQQMRRAGLWRLGMRRSVLAQLSGLGRNPAIFAQAPANMNGPIGGGWGSGFDLPKSRSVRMNVDVLTEQMEVGSLGNAFGDSGVATRHGSVDSKSGDEYSVRGSGRLMTESSVAGWEGAGDSDGMIDETEPGVSWSMPDASGLMPVVKALGGESAGENRRKGLPREEQWDLEGEPNKEGLLSINHVLMAGGKGKRDAAFELEDGALEKNAAKPGRPLERGFFDGRYWAADATTIATSSSLPVGSPNSLSYGGRQSVMSGEYGAFSYASNRRGQSRFDSSYVNYGDWLGALFPHLPPAPAPEQWKEPKRPWPADAKALVATLLRNDVLAKLPGGMQIQRQTESFDTRFGDLTGRATLTSLVSPSAWLTRSEGDGQTILNWCNKQERGVIATAFQLGRLRASQPSDLEVRAVGLGLDSHMLTALDRSYPESNVEVRPQGGDRTLLRITWPNNPAQETQYVIDTARHVVLSIEQRQDGKLTASTKYDDFVEAGGAWWPGRVETFDGQGRRISLARLTFAAYTEPSQDWMLAAEYKKQLAGREQVQFLREPPPKLIDAKRAVATGKASFEDQLTMAAYFAATQQWTKVQEHLDAAEKLAAGKQGMRWVRNAVLNISRRREELKTRIMNEAAALTKASPDLNDLFLANHLLGQSANILEANEMLRLLDALKPVFDRQPPHRLAQKQWRQQRVSYLNQTGQAQEAMKLLAQLAADCPHDYSLQQQYANALAGVGEHEAAFKLLEDLLGGQTEWLPHEAESLCGTYAQLMQNQGRWSDLQQFLAKWIARNPESASPYQQQLSVLMRLDKQAEADALAARWLKEGKVVEKLPPAAAARLGAALSYMQGQCQGIYMNRLDEQWLRPMADAAIFFARHESLSHIADQIMNEWRFTQTDECRRVRKAAAAMLVADIEKLKPAVIGRLVNWAMANDPAVEQQQWRKIAEVLRKRWDAEKDIGVKNQLAGPLVQILSGRLTPPEWIDFLRVQWQQGPQEYRPGYAAQLFEAITAQPWTAAYEDEAFSLLDKLSNADEPVARLVTQIAALHRLTDRMVEGRYQAKVKEMEHPEKLTRIELRAKHVEARKLANEGFADRLHKEMSRREGPIVAWLNAERLYLDVLAGRNLDKAADECWEFVGNSPLPPGEGPGVRAASVENTESQTSPHPNPLPTNLRSVPGEGTAMLNPVLPEGDGTAMLDAALRARLLAMLANLAARKNAPAGAADRLLKYVDAGISASDKDDLRWRAVKYQLLVTLDRPKELERALREWIAAEGPLNRWRLTLGYLLAEQGKLAEAIALFEAVAATDELGPAEYRTLADWHMAMNHRDAYERAMISVYKMADEWRLSNLLSQKLQPWQRRDIPVPSELDKEVLLVFPALFEKSPNPQNYLWQLQQFYRETHDFRLLACLADAVVGHTAGKVYPFLQGMSGVLAEVRDEATADAIVEQLAKVRGEKGDSPHLPAKVRIRAKTDVDQRAIDLLETLVERRASEVINQPGPHVEKALAALQRAFQRQWSPGEPRLMADFLGALGNISQPRLAAEQTRQLESLYQQAAAKTADRLHIALRLANVHWAYARQDAAIDLLALELREYQAANGGILPADANDPLGTLVSYFEQRRHYVRGEDLLFEQLKHPANAGQKLWLTQRLYELYENALRNDGEVSLGKAADFYRALVKQLQADLNTGDPNHRNNLLNRLCSIFRAAHEKKFPGVADDLRAFAFQRFPEVLSRDLNNYSSMVSTVAQTLHDVAGARDGLAFLIERIEREPRWLRYSNQDGWQQHGWQIAQWRAEVKDIGDLDPRLLKIVLAELRADLETQQQHNRVIYYRGNSYYWAEKEKDFADAAEEVYGRRKNSGAGVAYIAEYLYHGLAHHPRAIEMLLIAWKQGLLEEGAQSQLVQYLHQQQRFGESIAVLLPLVERRPDNMQYRVWLMHAYFHTQQPAQLLDCLKQTDEHFHKEGRWTEGNMAGLAHGCLDCQLFAQAAKYYQEVIPLHQRTAPNRGIGDGTLSEYYRCLALVFAGLKNTPEAVEAACGSIVSWGPRHDQRNQALESLKQVLRQSPDLDAYVAQLDKQSAETGLQNPIVRKALGQIYLERKKFDEAIAQLRLAVELQPNDAQTHQALLACCDQRGDKEGGVRQLLESVQLSRRDIALYQDLGRRYAVLNRPADAERAVTSIVEMLPAEAESHIALAEIRQTQNRWNEAIDQWRQVARIRALEPTGLLKLAEAQIHQQLWDDAEAAIRQLESRTWPSRFGDAENQTRQLRQRIEQGRKTK